MIGRVVIVGASIGGVRTAQALRLGGFEGEVLLVGEEEDLPYDRPPLSKSLMATEGELQPQWLLSTEQATADNIQLLLGHKALSLDPTGQRVEIDGVGWVDYGHLVVATGASARPSPWGQPPGVHLLRSLTDARALHSDLLKGGQLVVVGGGFIGAEVAASARSMGVEVVMVDPMEAPMSRVLNVDIARLFADKHRAMGVDTRFGRGVVDIRSSSSGLEVVLSTGESISADTVLVGIGATPNDEWLETSGLALDDGILLDECCRALGSRSIYAVGDVARWRYRGRGQDVRVEHWTNAVEQATCVAHNILNPDAPRPYTPTEYVWSDQYDWKIQVVGVVGGSSRLIRDPATPERFVALYGGESESLDGAVVVNWPKALLACRRAIAAGARLLDVAASLTSSAPRRDPS